MMKIPGIPSLLLALTLALPTLHAQTTTWTGNLGSSWDTPGNWNPQVVPTAGIDAVIANVTNQPRTIGAANPACRNLIVAAGADLGIDPGFALSVEGSSILNGTISGGGLLVANGAGTISAPPGNPYPNLEVTGTYSFVGNVTISGNLQQRLGAGSLGFSGGTITVNGDASFFGGGLNDSANSTLHVNGNVNLQTGIAVTAPPSILEVVGNLQSNGNFQPDSGMVAFVGTLEQTVTSPLGLTWFNLRIVAGASVTTDLDVITKNDLEVTGLLTTTGSAIQIGGNCHLNPLGGITTVLTADSVQSMSVDGNFLLSGGQAALGMATLAVTGNTDIAFSTLTLGAGTHRFSGSIQGLFETLTIAAPSTFLFDGIGSINLKTDRPLIVDSVDIAGTYTIGALRVGDPNLAPAIPGNLNQLPGAGALSFSGHAIVTGNALFEGATLAERMPTGSTLDIGGDATMQTSQPVIDPPVNITVGGAWSSTATWAPTSGTVTLTNPNQTVTATNFSTTTIVVGSASPTTLNISNNLSVTGTMTVLGAFAAPLTALTVTGNLVLQNPSDSLQGSPGRNEVSGDVTNNGSITGSGTLTLTGTGTLSGTGSFAGLAIDTGGTVTAGNLPSGIGGNFDLLAGTFDLAPDSLVRITGPTTFSGGVISGSSTAILDLDGNALWLGTTAGPSMPMIEASGDWAADENFAPTTGTVTLDRNPMDFSSTLAATTPGGTVNFDTLVISGNVTISSELLINAQIMSILMGGVLGIGTGANDDGLDLGPVQATLLGTVAGVSGLLSIGDASLCIEGGGSLNVDTGGTLRMVGTPGSPATICGPPGGSYQVNISGRVEALFFEFREMGPTGIRILATASIAAAPFDMRAGLFANGASGPGSVQLDIASNITREFRDTSFTRAQANMPEFNVRSNTNSTLTFANSAGNFAGPGFEDDPNNVIEWPLEMHTALATFQAKSLIGHINVEFTTTREIDLTNFRLFRMVGNSGMFTELPGSPITPLGSTTGGASYSVDDPAVVFPTLYTYRLEEDLPQGPPRVLGIDSATPRQFQIGQSLFVGTGGFVDISAAIAAAPIGSNIIVAGGTYPAFVLEKSVRIMSDGSGPILIDTLGSKILIRNIPAGQPDIALYDLQIISPAGGATGIAISNCDNVIILDRVQIAGATGITALSIADSRQVAIQDCTLEGTDGIVVGQNSNVIITGGNITTLDVSGMSTVTDVAVNIGMSTTSPGSVINSLAGSSPRLDFPNLWPTSESIQIELRADPGDSWCIWQSGTKGFFDLNIFLPAEMILLLDPFQPLVILRCGNMPPSGQASGSMGVVDDPSMWGMNTALQIFVTRAPFVRFGNVRDAVFLPPGN